MFLYPRQCPFVLREDFVSSITALQPHELVPVDPGPFRGRRERERERERESILFERIRFGCAEQRTVLVPHLPPGTGRQRDGKLAELAHVPVHTTDFANTPPC